MASEFSRDAKKIFHSARRVQRMAEEADKEATKEAAKKSLESRLAEVASKNQTLRADLESLNSLLRAKSGAVEPLSWSSIQKRNPPRSFNAASEIGPPPEMPNPNKYRTNVEILDLMNRWARGQERYEKRLADRENRNRLALEAAQAKYRTLIRDWKLRAEAAENAYNAETERIRVEVERHNEAIEDHRQAVAKGESWAIENYFQLASRRADYSDGFPSSAEFRYDSENRVTVECELPHIDVVPKHSEYVYDKARDQIQGRRRDPAEVNSLYRRLIAAIALRTMNEVFGADPGSHVDTCLFNGRVETINPATGETTSPCLISVESSKLGFKKLVLERVDPVACVEGLGGLISARPADFEPVRALPERDAPDPDA